MFLRHWSAPLLIALLVVPSIVAAPRKAKKPATSSKSSGKNAEATAKLLEAAAAGDEDRILSAIAAGADVNARDDGQATPLILTAPNSLFMKERKVVEAFVKAGAKVDAADKDGMTALMAAASTGRDGMVRLLLENGAKVDALDNDGWTALHYAASAGRTSAVKELIDAKTDVNLVAKDGWTPMMMALVSGRGGVVENLLKGGAKIPAKSPEGLSALYLASRGRDLSAVRQILAAGQPLDGRDEDEWTSLELASFYGDGQIVMELLRAGADASLKDKEGKTALDRAKENQDAELVGVLGGSWNKPKQSGGVTINIPCPALGGTIETNLRVDGTALVVTTAFPRPLVYYFGGGNMNRAESAKKFTYEGSFVPAYYLDTDSNPKTGLKETMFDKEAIGSEYAIDYSQYGTSVTLTYKDSKGNERSKPVFANVLSVDIKKEKEKDDEDVDTSALGDDAPRPANVDGVLVTKVPLSLLALTPGKTIRVVSKIGSCTPVTSKVKLQ